MLLGNRFLAKSGLILLIVFTVLFVVNSYKGFAGIILEDLEILVAEDKGINIKEEAKNGDAKFQHLLGHMYYYGKNLHQDYKEAAQWYRKAAEQGNADDQYSLGFMYRAGQGFPKDYIKAAKWYRKAAEQGNAKAQHNLGFMYFIGEGVTKDQTEAAKWLGKAAEQGHAEAQGAFGDMYYHGWGVPKDYKEAAEWYLKAAEQGNAFAQYDLGFIYFNGEGVPKDQTEAAKWLGKAAEQGYAVAQGAFGSMCYYGWGVPKDYKEAAEWFLKAAKQGDVKAQFLLGSMYECGEGVPEDSTKATEWYRKAAEQGNADARSELDKCLVKTNYPEWEYCSRNDTKYFFINKNKIRRQGNLVWFWSMDVPYQESHLGKKCSKNYYVADCGSAMSGLVSYIDYDSNDNIIDSHTYKKSEIDMSPVIPGSIGEGMLEYACSHAKVEARKKEEAAKAEPCSGTGWPVASGFVVTNNHVVEGHNHITLIRQDGVKIPATVAAHDVFNDLALLKVKDTRLLPAALPLSSRPAALGEKIVTVGYPHPDLLGVKPKLTEGVVNSTSGLGDDPRALQISVPIQAGNSGGPLVNMEGKVVGIVTSKVNAVKMFKWTGDLPQNINYGIKISYLQGLLSSVSPKKRIDTIRPFKYTSVKELAKKIKSSVLIIVAE